MSKIIYVISLVMISLFISCGNDDKKNSKDENSSIDSSGIKNENSNKKVNCVYNTEIFKKFVQIQFGATLEEVIKILGEPDEKSVDGDIVRLEFLPIEGIPLIVWVNSTNNKVETIRLEILGIGEYMNEDIQNAVKEYKMDECTAVVLGQTRKFIEERFGKPSYAGKEETTDVIDYYNDDSSIQVTLKFWQEQDYKCTQINLNWYYD